MNKSHKTDNKFNKTELIDFMAEFGHSKHNSDKALTKVEADKSLTWVLESILELINRGTSINITGFGLFEVQHRAARNGRNPKTGENMKISAYNQPVFKAGRKMKDMANNS